MLRVRGLCKTFRSEAGREVQAAQDVTFEAARGQFFTLLGPSGCGKTTTLRAIAGLERPNAGEISVNDRVVYSGAHRIFVPPNRRGFGMVFQSYAIWPHMTVFGNVAFPLQAERKYSRAQINDKVMRALHVVALDGFEMRKATQLSGGQQQRLALARALVREPRLLLLDEPLSNLDAKLRERMRLELKRLQRELGLTTIYVTHDQSEALALSHEIAVMNQGTILQLGTPKQIYRQPVNRFVADFVGTMNFLAGRVIDAQDGGGRCRVSTKCGTMIVRPMLPLVRNSTVSILIRPENIQVSTEALDFPNVWAGVIDTHVFLGDYQDLQVCVGREIFHIRVHSRLELETGQPVFVYIDPEQCNVTSEDNIGSDANGDLA